MNQSAYSDMPQETTQNESDGIPISAALRVLMGVGFLAVGLIQGVGAFTGEVGGDIAFVIDGIGFFLLAGTGVTMLMNRFYSLYLLLLWAVLGVVGSFTGPGELALPALFAHIMVGLVALAAVGQKKARPSI
jgi:hypothetical protein